MRPARRVGLVVLALSMALPASALDFREGRLLLTLYEQVGRFNVSVIDEAAASGFAPLLVDEDPRTTVLAVAIGNRMFRLGESSAFDMQLVTDADAPGFLWTSQQLEIKETFAFIASSLGRPADGIILTLTIRNVSEDDLEVGARYIFDTFLGEAGSDHFALSNGQQVSRELTMQGSSTSDYWVSGPQDGQTSLLVTTSGGGTTRPDRVVFANWKRLNDVAWTYATSSNRNFNLPPFSIGDSSASHYYGPRVLPRGATWTIRFVIGQYLAAGFDLEAAASNATADTAAVIREAVSRPGTGDSLAVTSSVDLTIVQAVVAELNRYLDGEGAVPSAEDLDSIRAALAGIRAKLDAAAR